MLSLQQRLDSLDTLLQPGVTINVTESFDAKRLLMLLLTLRTTTEPTLRDRILALDSEITTLDQTIANREAALNAIIYRLYHLTPEEIAMVEGG